MDAHFLLAERSAHIRVRLAGNDASNTAAMPNGAPSFMAIAYGCFVASQPQFLRRPTPIRSGRGLRNATDCQHPGQDRSAGPAVVAAPVAPSEGEKPNRILAARRLPLALMFVSWFALILFAARALWFHRRVLEDEARLQEMFGRAYLDYQRRVKRWIPGLL